MVSKCQDFLKGQEAAVKQNSLSFYSLSLVAAGIRWTIVMEDGCGGDIIGAVVL